MSRSRSSARVFRLSCGCVTEFGSLPAVSEKSVLCGTCGKRAQVTYRYPDACCGEGTRAVSPDGKVVRVRCTLRRHSGKHYDESAKVWFELPGRLRSGREGNT